MNLTRALYTFLSVRLSTATGAPPTTFMTPGAGRSAAESLLPVYQAEDTLTEQHNFNGWVNPEDLIPMPQCIAQQNQANWLSYMTKCTRKRCTSHFGIICTHHQWLVQLSCLSSEFSPAAIEAYLPYCSRSILAKAQLYHWIRSTTGRTWLVDVGDANELEILSPASLVEGYEPMDVTYRAPECLTSSFSNELRESFSHAMGSCSFTGATQRTGNTARPWEYRESMHSMIPLGLETAGYDLVGESIKKGEYFDKECFCSFFITSLEREPCLEHGELDLTRERLWINAACGQISLPDGWRESLKTIGFEYMPVSGWSWPKPATDLPKQVKELPNQCETKACELDSSGYCEVKPAIDRSCVCRDISYDACRGLCRTFETRINYVQWLHDLCGNLQDWHGLPDNWRQLAAPSTAEMIPWDWSMTPIDDLGMEDQCVSDEWKLGSIVLLNLASLLAVLISTSHGAGPAEFILSFNAHWCGRLVKGVLIAAVQILANCIIGWLVKNTVGYEETPVLQLTLLWCTIPQLGWLAIFVTGIHEIELMDFSSAVSFLTAEVVLQGSCFYYMFMTVFYGLSHNFYFRDLTYADRGQPAKLMYIGALFWLMVIFPWFIQAIKTLHSWNIVSDVVDIEALHKGDQTASASHSNVLTKSSEASPLLRGSRPMYGAFKSNKTEDRVSRRVQSRQFTTMFMTTLFLWISRWMFWAGFIQLTSIEFCPPKLGILSTISIIVLSGSTWISYNYD